MNLLFSTLDSHGLVVCHVDWLTGWQGVYLIGLFVVLTIGSSVVYCVVH